ncbi:hypothetical protein Tco_0267348 [Tanacetum coccineum]
MRQVCCSVVSAVVFRLLFVFFMLEFGIGQYLEVFDHIYELNYLCFLLQAVFLAENHHLSHVHHICSDETSTQPLVGATLGAIVGVVIGWSHKTRFMQNAIIGAVSGTALSYKLTKATFDHLNSDDDDELGLAVNLVMIIYGHLEIMLSGDEHKIMGFYKVIAIILRI